MVSVSGLSIIDKGSFSFSFFFFKLHCCVFILVGYVCFSFWVKFACSLRDFDDLD